VNIIDSKSLKLIKSPIDENLLLQIGNSVEQGEPISFIITYATDKFEEILRSTLIEILSFYGQEALEVTLYSVIKELIINAVKANVKSLFFRQKQLDLDDKTQYQEGTELYKSTFNEEKIEAISEDLEHEQIFVEVIFKHSNSGITMEVINSAKISKYDQMRMQEKVDVAKQYDDLAHFFIEHADMTEGAGMGIALIIILLKGEGFDPNILKLGVENQKTTAKLEIPFN
jgi:hypothetical protein